MFFAFQTETDQTSELESEILGLQNFELLNPAFSGLPTSSLSTEDAKVKGNLKLNFGQWLWLSWQSGQFQLQRSTVRIESSAKFIQNIVNC